MTIVEGDHVADLPPHVLDLVRHQYSAFEPRLDEMIEVLGRQGAREIWHKHGTFLDHLLGVWRILTIWRQPADVCRLGLMHSIYSNSFVRMKVFDAEHADGRAAVRDLVGEEAERLVYLFCEIRREELLSLAGDTPIPADGFSVGLHRQGEPVLLSRHDLGIFLVVTMADYAEQLYAWQDRLLGAPAPGGPGRAGAQALWPGENSPGLWMSLIAKLAQRAAECGVEPLPPVLAGCTAGLSQAADRESRDLYWQVVCDDGSGDDERIIDLLRRASAANPFVAEPHVLLSQMHLNHRRWDAALDEATTALRLLGEWGTSWDKRLSWEAWIAWSRVLAKGAREHDWPESPFGIISLGEVRPGL